MYVNPTPMSLLVNLVSSNDGCWVDIRSVPPFLCPLFYLEQIFYSHLFAYFFLTVIATCNTFQQVIHKPRESSYSRLEWGYFTDISQGTNISPSV